MFKILHTEKPLCTQCKHISSCKLTYKDCNINTKWIKPCLQNCKYHNICKREMKDNSKGEITYKCMKYKPVKLKIGFVPIHS